MRYLASLIIILAFLCGPVQAQSFPPLKVEETDGDASGVTTKIIFPDNTGSRTRTEFTYTVDPNPIFTSVCFDADTCFTFDGTTLTLTVNSSTAHTWTWAAVAADALLLESGDYLLLESGDRLSLE